jgi:tetratricopeptide (TPR) repeat protein
VKKSVLLIPASSGGPWSEVERALLSRGLQLLRVQNFKEAAFRLDHEIFSVIVMEDDAKGERQRQFSDLLRAHPFGSTTPVVVLGPDATPAANYVLTSLLDQYFQLSIEPETLAEFVAETHAVRTQKAKKGTIYPISPPQILFQAARFRMTGTIVLERSDEKCVIYLENGLVVFASSNRDENRFGEFLVARGIITRDQFSRSIQILKTSKKRMGKILVDEGFLKPQVLQTLLQSQIKHIVFTVFDWKSGEFYILPDEACQKENAIARVEVAPLILEGVRFKFNEELLNAEFEPFDSKVSLTISLDEVQRRMRLGKEEFDFLRLIGNGRSMDELIHLNSYSRVDALKFIYGFKVLGILSVQKGAYAPQKAMPSKDERTRAVDALFSAKIERPEPTPPPAHVVAPRPRIGWAAFSMGSLLAGLALTAVTIFFSFVNTRTSQVGTTLEKGRSYEPDLQEKLQAASVTATPTARPAPVVPANAPANVPPPMESAAVEPPSAPNPEIDAFADLTKLALRQRKEGRLHESLSTYRKVLALQPTHVETLVTIGEMLLDLDRPMEAVEMLDQARKLDPSDPRPYLGLGTILLMRNKTIEAKNMLQTYLNKVRPDEANRTRIMEVRRILKNMEQ